MGNEDDGTIREEGATEEFLEQNSSGMAVLYGL